MDMEKVIKALERCKICDMSVMASDRGKQAYYDCEYTTGLYCRRDLLIDDTIALLKEQEHKDRMFHALEDDWKRLKELLKEQEAVEQKTIPTELKQKMWNAFYAEEDEYEKKFVGKEEHLNWFTVYRPWLQAGFNIAIDAIADWEGR